MAERTRTHHHLLWGGLLCLAAILTLLRIAGPLDFRLAGLGNMSELTGAILFYSTLPRLAVALLAGAALGLSGHLLQRVLRNPLAEPTTLGIASGAQLAMAAATIYMPAAMAWSRDGVAFAGGAAAAGLVMALTWRRGLEPVSVLLGGMMIALTASAASAALILANGEYMFSLFIWGGGSLVQQGWAVTSIAVTLAVVAALSLLLLRPLTILGLDDANAKSLGVALTATRLLVIALAVWLATTVTAQLGVIGFVGLAAPALARLSGARTPRQLFMGSMLVGALLLWLTDGLVQVLSGAGGERIPTGAATALIGGPLLLWMLPRLSMLARPQLADARISVHRAVSPGRLIAGLAVLVGVAAAVAMVIGRGPDGWTVATGELLADLGQWRGPRVAAAGMAGAMLAAAGVILQKLTGNPLASPEVLGVGAGAGVGFTAAAFLFVTPGLPLQLAFSVLGALLVLSIMLTVAAKARFGRSHLLLAGVAMGAVCSAVLTSVIALGNMQSFEVLRWLSGSTNDITWTEASFAAFAAAILILPLPLVRRWLEILPLGDRTAAALGLSVRRTRLVLVTVSALLTASASLLVGPLSFVGLVAPHIARRTGLVTGLGHLAGALLIGAALMIIADWLSRMAAFPYQMPVGLFAALVSGPYLVWFLGRGRNELSRAGNDA